MEKFYTIYMTLFVLFKTYSVFLLQQYKDNMKTDWDFKVIHVLTLSISNIYRVTDYIFQVLTQYTPISQVVFFFGKSLT